VIFPQVTFTAKVCQSDSFCLFSESPKKDETKIQILLWRPAINRKLHPSRSLTKFHKGNIGKIINVSTHMFEQCRECDFQAFALLVPKAFEA